MQVLKRRPSPALIVSVVAVVLALVGTAIAGQATISALTGQEKKTVKKIARKTANKRITARAKNLSVKSAETADSANSLSNLYWAAVDAGGSIVRSSPGFVRVVTAGTGTYRVTTNRNVTQCSYQVTLGGSSPSGTDTGEVSANPSTIDPNAVFVATFGSAGGAPTPKAFTVWIIC